MIIEIPVAIAELFDKISILEIKLRQIKDPIRLAHVERELDQLMGIVRQHQLTDFVEDDLYRQLRHTNQVLWDVCELRRHYEEIGQFDDAFIEKSRLEYKTNDQRARLKQQINQRFDSTIVEIKSYKQFNQSAD